MKLYHGTNQDFEIIDIEKSNPYKDFGKGFYLTDIQLQAEKLAQKKAHTFSGNPVVQVYEFDETKLNDPSLKVLIFEKPIKEWAEFIYLNRRRSVPPFKHEYDIVVGPIADDGVAYLLNRYEEGTFSLEELAKELEYKKLNSQLFFGTQRAIKLLKRIS